MQKDQSSLLDLLLGELFLGNTTKSKISITNQFITLYVIVVLNRVLIAQITASGETIISNITLVPSKIAAAPIVMFSKNARIGLGPFSVGILYIEIMSISHNSTE